MPRQPQHQETSLKNQGLQRQTDVGARVAEGGLLTRATNQPLVAFILPLRRPQDSWQVDFRSSTLIRRHKKYRTRMFVPIEGDCPMALSRLSNLVRVEKILPVDPYTSVVEWSWRDGSSQDQDITPWVGQNGVQSNTRCHSTRGGKACAFRKGEPKSVIK